jgi:hypothetical protein
LLGGWNRGIGGGSAAVAAAVAAVSPTAALFAMIEVVVVILLLMLPRLLLLLEVAINVIFGMLICRDGPGRPSSSSLLLSLSLFSVPLMTVLI